VAPEPEPLFTGEFVQTKLRTILETAFRSTGKPFVLPDDLPDVRIAYLSVKNRPMQRVLELAYRSADLDWKGVVVVRRDGTYETQRRPVERAGLELPIPPVGARLTGTAGTVRLAITSLKEMEPGKIEVRIESIAPTDQIVSSRHEWVSVIQVGNLPPQRSVRVSDGFGIVPTFKTRGGVVLDFEQQMRKVDPMSPERTNITGVLTVDPNDPPAIVTWELYLWRK